jgi:RHS repeat-associated protein
LIAEYRYDALGRRINKKVFNSPGLDTYVDGDFFYYDGNRIVEFHRTQKHSVTDCWTYECPGPPSGKLQSVDDAPVGKVINGEYVETKVQTTIGEEIKNDSGVRSHTCTSCTTTTTYPVKLVRQLVYGLEGIDEEVAHFTDGTTLSAYYVLQDAGGDVVAIAKADGALHEQYFYEPYGTLLAAENYNGDSIDIAAAPQTIFALLFHKGLWRDHETGTYQNRNRFYIPALGRFGQPDPYGSGLVLATALLRNGQVASAAAGVSSTAQYADGMSPYQYVGSSPVMNRDPSGLFALQDLLTAQSLSAYLRTTGTFAGIGLAGAGVFGGLRSGYEAQLSGATTKEIATAAVLGAGYTGYQAFARILVASAIIATGPGGLALAGGIGVFESAEAYGEARARQEGAQTQADLSLATFDSVFATLGVGGSLYATSVGVRGATLGANRGPSGRGPRQYAPKDLKEKLAIDELEAGSYDFIMGEMGDGRSATLS